MLPWAATNITSARCSDGDAFRPLIDLLRIPRRVSMLEG